MKDSIQAFLDDKKLAIVGASPNKENFGKYLIAELLKLDYSPIPVNPKYDEVEGVKTIPSVKELPPDIENVILAVPSSLCVEIVDQCIETPIKRIWMIRGMGKGTYTETAHKKCMDHEIEVVHGFCPMMFFGAGMHKFHFWLRKRFGKMPAEFLISEN